MKKVKTAKYLATKRYRAKHPERRAAERKKNYAQTGGSALNRNHGARWTSLELKTLESWAGLTDDRTLHKLLGRSVQAIQNKRHNLLRQLNHHQGGPLCQT